MGSPVEVAIPVDRLGRQIVKLDLSPTEEIANAVENALITKTPNHQKRACNKSMLPSGMLPKRRAYSGDALD